MTETSRGETTAIAPGSRVVVRDEEWLVTQVSPTRDGRLVTCVGLSELVRDTTAQFSEDLENLVRTGPDAPPEAESRGGITPFDPRSTAVRADVSPGYGTARLWVEATLRKSALPVDDPHLDVAGGALADSLDYQHDAVRTALDPASLRPRILLADAVGLGKTLEIGMILAELVRRGRGERILVVTPRHVLEQMQHELWTRFALPLVRLDSVGIQQVRRRLPASRNPFGFYRRAIISIDTLKNDRYLAYLRKHRWDAVVIDESHNITNRLTQNNRLADLLAAQTDALILASATPHNGRAESFAELVRLLEPTAVRPDGSVQENDLSRLVVRRHRHSPQVAAVVGADWAERREPRHVLVPASPTENEIASQIAEHWLYATHDGGPGRADGLFGWTLAKAFLSSPAALAETASRRLSGQAKLPQAQRDSLVRLLAAAEQQQAQTEGKYAALLSELDRIGVAPKSPERVVVFAERVPTLEWLTKRLRADRRFSPDQVRVLHGGLSDVEQQQLVESFKQAGSPIRVLVTGDVASEGVNLHQQCHELIHYDIPWSLIRIEQRNGRIDRYGQRHHPQITTLLLQPDHDRFRGDLRVLRALVDKEQVAHRAIGDAASLMGRYDVKAEEDAIQQVLLGARSLEEVVREPEDVAAGGDLLALLTRLQSAATAPAEAGEKQAEATTSSGSGLFSGEAEYLREAVRLLYPRPEQPPSPGGGGGVAWREEPGHGTLELVPPPDLVQRLEDLPQTYLQQRQVATRLKLAVTKPAGERELRQAQADQAGSSWPEAHFLGPVHPVLDWAGDRVLARLERGEVFAVRGTVDNPVVLVQATLTTRSGLVAATRWVQVEFWRPDNPAFNRAEICTSAAAMLAGVGLGAAMTNPGSVADASELSRLMPAAVDAATRAVDIELEAIGKRITDRVDAWSSRALTWEETADTLLQQGQQLRQRRVGVAQELELARERLPEQQHVRPLLVVVPVDHPVEDSPAPAEATT